MSIDNRFTVLSWDEKSVTELGAEKKINRATVTQEYTGLLQGKSTIEYTMYYEDSQSSTFVGIESFEGVFKGKSGTLLLQHCGNFRDGIASSSFRVIDALDAFAGITGSGSFKTLSHCEAEYTIALQ